MINGKALTFDVCLNCYWRERFEVGREADREVIGMGDGEALRSQDWKGIYEDRDFLELLKRFYKRREQQARAPDLGKGN